MDLQEELEQAYSQTFATLLSEAVSERSVLTDLKVRRPVAVLDSEQWLEVRPYDHASVRDELAKQLFIESWESSVGFWGYLVAVC